MYSMPPPAFRDDLAMRLAHKTGLSQEQARKFLDAFAELIVEEEKDTSLDAILKACGYQIGSEDQYTIPSSPFPAKVISFPLVEQANGTMIVDTSIDSEWLSLPGQQPPSMPPEPGQPEIPPKKPLRDPRKRPPGGYPGPSVLIRTDPPKDPPQDHPEKTGLGGGFPGPLIKSLGGAYPGPSISISIHDPKRTGLPFDKIDLGNLGDALAKAKTSSTLDDLLGDLSPNIDKLGED